MKKYSLTPEHRAQLRPWHEKWVRIAMRTQPQTDEERARMIEAVNGLYDAANLDRPKHIVFVPSPIVGQIASGFAAAIWHLSENGSAATRDATWDATWAATRAATVDATVDATRAATRDATRAATRDATWAATMAATRDATEAATWAATRDATMAATRDATRDATEAATWAATEAATWAATFDWARRLAKAIAPAAIELLCSCAQSAMRMYCGGNMWAAGVDFVSFFREVANLPIDYSKWQHYQAAAELGGFRFMHPKFCIVVDFPEAIRVDQANRPHCGDGPSHRWRDGFEIYHWHGYRLPADKAWIIADKARITVDAINAEPNAELRRVMLEVYGFDRYLADAKAKVVDVDQNHGQPRRLLEMTVAGESVRVVEVVNGSNEPDGTRRKFVLGAARRSRREATTVAEAIAASYGVNPKVYREAVRT